jgi:hypothetical protein
VFAVACHWSGTTSIPGVTSDDLAAALAAVEGVVASLRDNGRRLPGQAVRLTVPADVTMGECDEGKYYGIGGF